MVLNPPINVQLCQKDLRREILRRIPPVFLCHLKRPAVQFNLNTELAPEVIGYSPRVPANPASPILHLAGFNRSKDSEFDGFERKVCFGVGGDGRTIPVAGNNGRVQGKQHEIAFLNQNPFQYQNYYLLRRFSVRIVTQKFGFNEFYFISYSLDTCWTSKGPQSYSMEHFTTPLKLLGIRHEYGQMPCHPYSNCPR